MMEKFLKSRLQPVIRRHQWYALNWKLAAAWAAAALVGALLIVGQRQTGWSSPLTIPILAALAGTAAFVLILRQREKRPDYRLMAQKIEQANPELKGLLLTAVQQTLPDGSQPGYLQYRVLQEAMERSREKDWRQIIPRGRFGLAVSLQVVALGLFIFALAGLRVSRAGGGGMGPAPLLGIAVTPGDASIERGESLVVLARFGGALPANVDMVVRTSGEVPRKIPLVKSLADPVFGGSVAEVKSDFVYHLEYRGKSTRDYQVTVFEHPRLERADAELTFPTYTGQEPKRIENTRRISAVEGTSLDLALQLNKPVVSAKLVARDAKKTVIPLTVTAGKAVATLPKFALTASQSYDLQLVDADGRTNKVAAPFVIDVLPNRPPELHVSAPRGDVRPSAIEEIAFDGTVWDDFGLPAYGMAYTVAGGETKSVELGRTVPGKEKRPFNYTLRLEELGVQPDQLVSWYVWAEDTGPDGKVRRTNSDLFFAEIRPFEEIFRESQQQQSQDQQQQQQGQGQGNQNRKLTELQKQIINATWKLQRDASNPKYPDDATVVHDSQQEALTQAGAAQEKAEDPRTKALWTAVTQPMEQAATHLKDAAKAPGPLAQALTAEQAAYQALLKLQARETQVSRGRGGRGGGGGGQGNQRQLDQLDLTQQENRYETQRQATPTQSPERREQLQVMNRLQELARRQQDVNDRLKELQTALQEARTDQQREDLRRQLKRLQEEQQQMLADADEVKQRMERPENQSQMNEQRQQMDQTRSDLQRAADAAGEGSVAQALAAGTRAQRQLQTMRDELHKESSSQFADDLRDMRTEARELANQQEEIAKKIGGADEAKQPKSLSDTPANQALIDQLNKQKDRMKELVDRTKQVSEQAENSEPLLAEKLYDSLRKLDQTDEATAKDFQQELLRNGLLTRSLNDRLEDKSGPNGTKALDLTGEMLRQGFMPQAGQAEQRARAGINELKNGVEKAAESILGDDTAALQMAQSELDAVTDQLVREASQAQGQGARGDPAQQKGAQTGQGRQQANAGARGNNQNQPGDPQGQGAGAAAGEQPDQAGTADEQAQRLADAGNQGRGQTPGQRQGQRGQRGQPGQRGQGGQPGQQPGENQDGQPSAQGQGQGQEGQSGQQLAEANGQDGQNPQAGQPGQAGQRGQAGQGNTPGARGGERRGGFGGGAGQPAADGGAGANGQRLAGGDRNGNRAGGDRLGLDNLINGGAADGGGANWGGPLTGDNFGAWADRLRDVEEMVDTPELRNAVAAARERARQLRVAYKNDAKKPDWTVVQLEIVKPLVEVRSRINDELARRESKDSLVPIDRDPVPNRYAESVRKYYEELGKDK